MTQLEDITLQVFQSMLWNTLVEAQEFALLERLREIEKQGYGTIIMPSKGFSKDDTINNMVIDWLRLKDILVYSPESEIMEAERALREGEPGNDWMKHAMERLEH